MRYAFLALVAAYLITFFGCSPEEHKNTQKTAAASHQRKQNQPQQPQAQLTEKEKEEFVLQQEVVLAEEQTEKTAEKQSTDSRSKVTDKATQNVLKIVIEKDNAPEKEEIQEKQQVEVEEKKPKEETLETENSSPVKENHALQAAVVQLDDATNELIKLANTLATENLQLKKMLTALIECPVVQKKVETATDISLPEEEMQQEQQEQARQPQEESTAEGIKDVAEKQVEKAKEIMQ